MKNSIWIGVISKNREHYYKGSTTTYLKPKDDTIYIDNLMVRFIDLSSFTPGNLDFVMLLPDTKLDLTLIRYIFHAYNLSGVSTYNPNGKWEWLRTNEWKMLFK